ncbi:hypothetical protein [Nitrospirillum sp. BR 11163]|uniref:hypothetical protein n=1 Tax=Nitrospirillum sp. BR 11163 TaxID=3104323 RepID=UPI002AFFB7C3|nr:hypothetical protein [Nitrospirillum sp. BR 11163]MEA1673046.1 hypothetical protein [Nitrospirillum sp. BR 11163]
MLTLDIRGADIDGDQVTCTGMQVASILDFIATLPELGIGTWYAGAVEGLGKRLEDYEEPAPRLVPALSDLLQRIRGIPQLLDGVFAWVPGQETPRVEAKNFTADGPMAPLVLNALVEIWAFDTSYIEVYTERTSIIAAIQDRFMGNARADECSEN